MNAVIIGSGFIAGVHARAVLASGHRLSAVCGTAAENTERFADTWGIPKRYTDYREIPVACMDCVHICTPPSTHFELCRYFVEHRIPVICEKPLTLDVTEAKRLYMLVREYGTPFGVCFHNRFYPALAEMQKILKSGRLGKAVLLYGSYEQEFHIPPVPFSWRFDTEGGNALRAVSEIGSHVFDLVQYICQESVAEVSALFQNRRDLLYRNRQGMLLEEAGEDTCSFPVKNEDTAAIQLVLQSGANVSLALSEISAGEQNHVRLHLICQKGRMSWDNQRADVLRFSGEKGSSCERDMGMQLGYADVFQKMIADFYAALSEQRTSLMATVKDAWENVKLCGAVYESAMEKRSVPCSLRSEWRGQEGETGRKRKRKEFLIRHFAMEWLFPEHTLFSECYHSPETDQTGKRRVSTMYGLYCREPDSFSRFHRLCHEEIWTFLEGDPISLCLLYEDGSTRTVVLGPELQSGQLLQYTVPPNVIQGGSLCPGGEYALYSCTVSPGFVPECFSPVEREEILKKYSDKTEILDLLNRLS